MLRSASAVAAAAVLLLCAAQVQGLVNCQWQGPSASYDLTPLAGVDLPGSDASYTYKTHLCGTASESTCAANGGSMCQYSQGPPPVYQHVLAKWEATGGNWTECTDPSTCPLGGVQIRYNNGDRCGGSGPARQVTFVVACGSGTNTQYAVTAMGCAYTVVFTHTAGCGVGPSSSSGSVNPPAAVSSSTGPTYGPPPYACAYTDASGLTYDLGTLFSAGDLSDSESDYNYQLHFCSNVTESKCWSQGGNFCQYNKQSGAYVHAISRWSQQSALQWSACADPDHCPQGGVEVTLANGDRCAGGTPRNVTFQVACAQGTQTAYTVEENVAAPCSYLVRLAHTAGCGSKPAPAPDNGGGSNGGKIAGAVIGTLLGVALLGGAFWWYRYRYAPSQRDAGMDTGMSNTGATGYQQQV